MVPRQMQCHSVKPPHYECMCEARLDELAPLCTSSEDVLFSHASLVPESPCWFHLDGVFFYQRMVEMSSTLIYLLVFWKQQNEVLLV